MKFIKLTWKEGFGKKTPYVKTYGRIYIFYTLFYLAIFNKIWIYCPNLFTWT